MMSEQVKGILKRGVAGWFYFVFAKAVGVGTIVVCDWYTYQMVIWLDGKERRMERSKTKCKHSREAGRAGVGGTRMGSDEVAGRAARKRSGGAVGEREEELRLFGLHARGPAPMQAMSTAYGATWCSIGSACCLCSLGTATWPRGWGPRRVRTRQARQAAPETSSLTILCSVAERPGGH